MKPLLNKAMMMAVIVIMSSRLLAQTIIYVDVDATGSDDGTTWANAYNDLQDALAFANGNNPAQIWIAEGTYKPGTTTTSAFSMINLVEIYGGFSGNETALNQRDFELHRTILSGEIGSAGPEDNVEHVISNVSISASAVLDGVEITRGGNLNVTYYSNGGGMYNAGASPTVRNCKFYDNNGRWGGAVFNANGSQPTFEYCEFNQNKAQERGGAIYHSSISGNTDLLTVVNSLFIENEATNEFLTGRGSAIMNGAGTNISLYNNLFYSNYCPGCPSAEGAVLRLSGTVAQVIGNIIWNNFSIGAIYDVSTNLVIANNIIEGGYSSGTDIINADPQFENPTAGNFRISYCSPAIDKGVSGVVSSYSVDYAGSDREVGSSVDIGPYEYSSGILVSSLFNVTCEGGNDGSVSLTSEGSSTFEYSLDGTTYQSGSTFSNLSAGVNSIYIRETSTSCVQTKEVTISEPVISITLTPFNATCPTTTDGMLQVQASGGTGPYEYSLDGVTYTVNSLFTSLSPGDYTIYVKDANGCVKTELLDLGPDPEPYTLTSSDITCNGANDGNIVIAATGSNSPYQYYLDNNSPALVGDFQGLVPGTYSIVIENGTGCFSDPISVVISEPAVLNASFSSTDITCQGANDGTIDATITGGTAPYEYQVNGGGFQTLTGSTISLSNLNFGTRDIDIRDANGCTVASGSISISEPMGLGSTYTETDVTSCTSNDGIITITASGGTSPYQFSIDGGTTFQSNGNFSNLAPGNYSVLIEDANSCQTSVLATIENPFAFTVSATTTDANCFSNNDGTITVTASGGTGPYEYSLDGITYQSSNVLMTGAGNITYYVRDTDNGCVTQGTATVGEPTAISGTLTVNSDVSCNGGTDGEITVSATGGTSPYTYTLDGTNYQSSATFSGLTAGTYFVGIKDDNGCNHSTSTVTISEPAVLSLTLSSAGDISCNGDASGSISSAVTGGTAPYNFNINGGDFDTNGDFEDLPAGTYTIIVEDANGCQDTETFDVTEPDAIVLTLSSTDATCNGDADGSITASATGGTGTFTYSIDGTNFSTSTSFTALAAGSYTIVVRDANNCETSESVTVGEPGVLGVQATITNISCNGETDGSVVAVGSGGTSPYSYSLDGTNFQSSDTFSDLAAGSYTLTIEDVNGCTTTEAFSVTEPDELTIAVTQDGRNDFSVTAAGGTLPYEYSIDAINFQAEAIFTDLAPGQYRFTVRDANGCVAHSTAFDAILGVTNMEVSIYPNPVSDYLKIEGIDFDYASIIDLNGKEILRSNDRTISIGNLAAGIHLINVYRNNRVVHQQKIKIN